MKIDMNKVNLILEMAKNHLKEHDSYRVASSFTATELTFLKGHFNIVEVDSYSNSIIYEFKLKSDEV